MRIKILITVVLITTKVYGKDTELDNIINSAMEKSHAIKASLENASAAGIVKERSSKHWLPQVYLNAQSYLTNDPGAALFGKLSQREIENSDFISDSLNNPSTDLYTKASLGVNLPLYEGGQKVSMNKGYTLLQEAKSFEAQALKKEVYVEIVKTYFNGLSYMDERKDLEKMAATIDSMINRYQVGRRENQLGYSGLLGMKSLKNKTAALISENKVKTEAVSGALNELSGKQNRLEFSEYKTMLKQIDDYLNFSNDYTPSENIEAQIKNAEGAKEFIAAEKSRNLPRIGLFGENTIFNGERGTGNGFSAGVYINWNLFSSNDYGAQREAVHKYHAAKSFAEASLQKEKIEFNALVESVGTIKNSLKLLEESDLFLAEQTNISNDLFKNGMINALQYVEVLSRRIDLIQSKSQAREQLISAQAQLAKMNGEEAVNGQK